MHTKKHNCSLAKANDQVHITNGSKHEDLLPLGRILSLHVARRYKHGEDGAHASVKQCERAPSEITKHVHGTLGVSIISKRGATRPLLLCYHSQLPLLQNPYFPFKKPFKREKCRRAFPQERLKRKEKIRSHRNP